MWTLTALAPETWLLFGHLEDYLTSWFLPHINLKGLLYLPNPKKNTVDGRHPAPPGMYESLFKRNTIFSISTGDRWISGCHQQDDQHRPHISEIFHAFFQLTPKILLSPGKPRIPVLASDRQRTTNGGKRGQGGMVFVEARKNPCCCCCCCCCCSSCGCFFSIGQ